MPNKSSTSPRTNRKRTTHTQAPLIATKPRLNKWAVIPAVGIFVAISATLVYSSFAATTPKPNGPSGTWKLKFADEFTSAKPDTTKWTDYSSSQGDRGHGNKGNNKQLEWNQMANCSNAGGVLTLTAKRDTSHSGYKWTSCLLTTSHYAFKYGYIEERSIMPSVKGFWPAFWTWQAPGVNVWNETDVYEYYSNNPTKFYLTQQAGKGGHCKDYTPKFNPTTGYHTYGADIEAGGTDWYIDGAKVCHTAATSVASSNIITNLAVFADIQPASTTKSAVKKVDYIRAWQR